MSDSGGKSIKNSFVRREDYLAVQRESLKNPESFWSDRASQLVWSKKWKEVLDWKPPFAKWSDMMRVKPQACIRPSAADGGSTPRPLLAV